MKTMRIIPLAALIVASCLPLLVSCAQQDRAAAPAAGGTHGAVGETVTRVADQPIPNVPGKRLVSVAVDYLPGGYSTSHRHAASAFIYAYVISGEIKSQVNDEPVRVYKAGEYWFEKPGSHHRVSANASDTRPAKLLAVFVVDATEKEMTTPDAP